MKLEICADIMNQLSARFDNSVLNTKALSQTGEPFVIVCSSSGIRPSGLGVASCADQLLGPVLCLTKEKAVELFFIEFNKYAESKPKDSKIYWRRCPELLCETLNVDNGDEIERIKTYRVVARLLLSNKPQLPAIEANHEAT